MKNLFLKRTIPRLLIVLVLLAGLILSAVPVQAADPVEVEYKLPVLKDGLDYYQTTFPSGLIYSSAWAGTFEYMPNNMEQVLFDDNASDEFGTCIFTLPHGSKPPSGPQGGTSLKAISKLEAETILKSYDLKAVAKPWDAEILEVMPNDHKYIGAWAGDKLAQKFTTSNTAKTNLTAKQQAYIDDTQGLKVKPIDLVKYDPDRFFVMGQTFWADGTADCSVDGRVIADTAFTVAGAGNFTINMANGTTGSVSGTNVTGSPVALSAGANTITTSGAVADGVFDITIGTAANWNSVNSWSAASGGACGASVPTNADNAYFNANSFTAGSQVVTVDAGANCLNLDFTGSTNNPSLVVNNQLIFYGNVTLISGMSCSGTSVMYCSANSTFDTGGLVLTCDVGISNTGVYQLTLLSNLSCKAFNYLRGTLITGNYTITAPSGITDSGSGGAKTLTPGSSVINAGLWNFNTTGANLTVSANTAIVNISGTGTFAGATNYNGTSFNLNGSSHLIAGAWTIANLTLLSTQTQTITWTDSTTYTATTFTLSGSSGHVHTLRGSGVAGWTLSQAAGTVSADYISISRSTAGGGATFNATGASINGGNNNNWNFLHTTTSQAATGVTMDKDGVTGGLFNGTLVDMGGEASNDVSFEYGLTAAYGSSTAAVAKTTPGTFTAAIPTTLTPGATYHFRSKAVNTVDTVNGSDQTFTFTMPAVTTTSVSAVDIDSSGHTSGTFYGNLTSLGVASNTYIYFQYGLTVAYGNNTVPYTAAAPAAYTASLPNNLQAGQTYHFRAIATNGATSVYGSDMTFAVPFYSDQFTGYREAMGAIPVILLCAIILVILWFFGLGGVHAIQEGNTNTAVMLWGFGLAFIAMVFVIFTFVQQAITNAI